jgi:putative zinc finger protein
MPAACAAVREQLAEYAVGVLSERDRLAVERHLEVCAACRKEAEELSGAAVSLAFALDPAPLPDGLLTRILARIARMVRAPVLRRRTRAAAGLAIAAMIALSSLGWGAVMAGRAERFETRAAAEEQRRAEALRQFQKLFGEFRGRLGTGLRADETRLVRLAPVGTGGGGGAAMELVSPSMLDFVIVHVSGLPTDAGSLPYRVWVVDHQGNALRAGRLTELDANGAGEVFHQFADTDLSAYTRIVIRDAAGHLALEGVAESVPAG